MPYGIEKELGGDSKENDEWMENCVNKVIKQGKDKGTAIAICKTSLKRAKGKNKRESAILELGYLLGEIPNTYNIE